MMLWNSENGFPEAVRRAAQAVGTQVTGRYAVREILYVSGMELYYHAEDLATGMDVTLCALLPMQWCRQDETGSFVPYHERAQMQWKPVKMTALARLQRLRALPDEVSLPELLDIFEEKGTIWYTMPYQKSQSLRALINKKIIAPKQAIHLLAPVMDTLAGLHDKGIYHGAVTANAVRLTEDISELRDWNSCTGIPDAQADVQAVSCLLYEMMTGETEYRSLTAAALPVSIRNALYNGMYDPQMSIAELWQQLHAKKAAKPIKVQHNTPDSILAKIFHPAVTAVFCLVCLGVPLLLWQIRAHSSEQHAVSASVPKFPDISYALSESDIIMPELLGLPQEDAMEQIKSLGLRVVLAKREDNPVVPENCVVTQLPDAGAIVREGDTVTLAVSDGWENYVPDVTNMLLETAQERLKTLGFVVEYEEVASPGDAPGTVISQDTKPQTLLMRDSTIHLMVSLGREDLDKSIMEEVGDYVGMNFETAKASLSELYLYAMQTEEVYDPNIPAGTIIAQDIPEGRKVPRGTIVNMKVSMGVETTRVPGVTLMSATAAKSTLESAGLICVICYVSDGDHVMDCVLSQNVTQGTIAPVGSAVWLTVSIGTASNVASTGGWSGTQLPTFEEETEETTEETPLDQTTATASPQETNPPQTAPPQTAPPQTDPPQTSPPQTPPPVQTDPPAPPAPPMDELQPPPMPAM